MGIKRGAEKSQPHEKQDITEDEAALYDRQIRLWGLESQKRLRSAKILLIGLGGLGAEVAKNIALAGVKSITLLDDKKVGPNDRSAQFFLQGTENGTHRSESSRSSIHQLNPNVEVVSETDHVGDKSDEYFSQFTVVCATDCSPDILYKLNTVCREHKVHFFCGDTWGYHGYCFVDLGSFTFLPSEVKSESKTDKPLRKKQRLTTMQFGSLEKALSFKSGKTGFGLHKKISKVFFLVHILLKFCETHQRFPLPEHREEDVESLKSLRTTIMARLGFNENKVKDEDLNDVFGELSPVCAVVGGVLSQEIIKAVCADQQPLQNFFLFDGDNSVGAVENIA